MSLRSAYSAGSQMRRPRLRLDRVEAGWCEGRCQLLPHLNGWALHTRIGTLDRKELHLNSAAAKLDFSCMERPPLLSLFTP